MSPCGRGIKINLLFLVWGKWGICSFGGGQGTNSQEFLIFARTRHPNNPKPKGIWILFRILREPPRYVTFMD